jgi:hypothetical protein
VEVSLENGGRIVCRNRFRDLLRRAGFLRLRGVMDYAEGDLLRGQGFKTVHRIRLGEGRFYLKRFRYPWLPVAILGALKLNPAVLGGMREWENIRRVARLGIPTALPVAAGDARGLRWEREGFVLTREIEGAEPLDQYLMRRRGDKGFLAEKLDLLGKVAHIVRRLHGADLFHRDLYLCHFLVRPPNGQEGSRVYLIDLQRVRRPRVRRRRWQIKDLAALNYSAPREIVGLRDRLRFFKAYLGVDRLDVRARRLAGAVLRKSRRLALHGTKG